MYYTQAGQEIEDLEGENMRRIRPSSPKNENTRVGPLTSVERRLINSLSPDERKEVLLATARERLKEASDASPAFPRKEDASWNDPEFKQLTAIKDSQRRDYD